jgi:cytochrome c
MKAAWVAIGAAATLAASPVAAQSGPDVLKAKGCLNCHETDKKKIGPAYKEIAAKYKDDKGAESKLLEKLREGKGHPRIAASEAELKAAVQHVLSLK